ncbi:MAG: hypothetical protein ACYSQY_03795, partial [Planctomycetota bacterium]
MLSNLEHQVAWYMSKHDDHQPGVVSSKRALLFQLPSGGSNTSPNIGDPNQPGNLFPAADPPAPQRVILKLKQAPSSRISAQPQSRSLASQAQPVPSQAEGPVPSDVEGPDPFDQIRQHFPAAAIKKVFPDKPSAPPGPSGPRQLQSAQKAPVSHGFDRLYGVQVELPPGQTLDEFVDFCNRIETVEYAEIDYPLTAHAVPNDPDFPLQWHLDNIGQDYPASGSYNPPPGLVDADIDAPEAWETVTDCNEVIIAVIDTGVDYDHPDLVNNMWVNSAELNGEPEVDDDD